MKKKRKICHYMSLPQNGTSRKPKEKDTNKLVVTCDVTGLFETMYEDNKRLVKENAVLRERAKPHFDKIHAIDAESIEGEDTNHA